MGRILTTLSIQHQLTKVFFNYKVHLSKVQSSSIFIADLCVQISKMKVIPLTFAVLGLMLTTGNALQCHQCSSVDFTKCGDPFYYDEVDLHGKKIPKTTEFLKDCPDDGKTYTLCRKMYQNVRGEERVTRTCGYEFKKEENECYPTVLEEYNTYVCSCPTDGCNGANAVITSTSIFTIGLAYFATKLLGL